MRKNIVIFDLDGTLVRSVPQSIDLFCLMLTRAGVRINTELRQALALSWGVHFAPLKERFFPDIPDETLYGFYSEIRSMVETHPFPGIAAALRAMSARGADIYVFTSGPRLHTRSILERFGIDGRFSRMLCVEDVGWDNAKPSAHGIDLIMEPLEAIGHERSEAVFIGDSPMADRLCAENAGVEFVAAHEENVVTRDMWLNTGVAPENILRSVRELPAWLGI